MYNINTSVDLSKYEKIGSKILKKLRNRTDERVVVDAKIRKVKNVGFLYIQKTCISNSIYDLINFVYILYSFYIV